MRELTPGDFAFLTELERYDTFLSLFHSRDPRDKQTLANLYASRDPFIPLILLQYLEELPERAAIDAILDLIESPNDIVARAAMLAYQRSHYPGKARQLKELAISKVDRACRFAVRTLSRAGAMEVLPLILREFNERSPAVRREMLDALRFLPNARTIPYMMPLSESPDPDLRMMATLVLTSIQGKTQRVPIEFFVRMSHDSSERVRSAALGALQYYPSKRVARIFLAQAVDDAGALEERERAVRSLAAFPLPEWVAPLVRLAAKTEVPSLRLAAEISLRGFPRAMLLKGMLPLLSDRDEAVKVQTAILAAQLVGEEPKVIDAILTLWDQAPEMSRVQMVDILRELGGDEPRRRLIEAAGGPPLLGASAAGALSRMRLGDGGKLVLGLLSSPAVPELTKQAFLGHWARSGPDEAIREDLLPWLIAALESDRINMRYLAIRTLAWYPLSSFHAPLLGLLAREHEPETVRTSESVLVKKLGRDPLPMLRELSSHPDRRNLMGHAVRILTSQSWAKETVPELVRILREPPFSFLEENPETFLTVCIHLLRDESLSFDAVLDITSSPRLRSLFLRQLASFLTSRERDFPPLPVDALLGLLGGGDAGDRRLLYRILGQDRRPACAAAVSGLLAREKDQECLAEGAASMRHIVLGRTQ